MKIYQKLRQNERAKLKEYHRGEIKAQQGEFWPDEWEEYKEEMESMYCHYYGPCRSCRGET